MLVSVALLLATTVNSQPVFLLIFAGQCREASQRRFENPCSIDHSYQVSAFVFGVIFMPFCLSTFQEIDVSLFINLCNEFSANSNAEIQEIQHF